MTKGAKNLLAVFAVLCLGLLVAGLVLIARNIIRFPAPAEEPALESAESAPMPSESETAAETTETKPASSETKIAVFQTSDIHGYIMDTTSGDESTFEYRLAYIAKIFDDARDSDEYDDVLIIDGGDIYQGCPVSNLTDGAVMRAAFDLMGYDAVALGNHEFDWDVDVYAADEDGTMPAYEIGDYSGDPDIPVIAADLYSASGDEKVSFTQDYVIVEKAGYRIALIGYIPDYSNKIMTSKIKDYEIKDDMEEFSALVKEINEKENPDVTIVVAHEYPVDVANALDPDDVDLVTGGHKHDGICGIADSGIPYIQGDCYAKGYSSAVIVIDSEGNVSIEDLMAVSITEEPELLYDTPDNADNFDPDILALSHAAWDSISDEMSEVLGYIDSSIEKKGYIDGPTTTGGNFITGLMLEYMEDEGVVAAFYNRGGVRADFVVPEGETMEITVGDIYAVSPFNNIWLVYDLTGEELAQQIENGFIESNYGDQVSGLTYEYYDYGTEEEPDVVIVSITLDDGTEVDIDGKDPIYRVVVSNYSATLEGSVFEGKTPVFPEADAPIDNQALIELLRDRRDSGEEQIPTDTSPRGTCLNAADEKAA